MGNGSTTEFSFNFPYFENSNIIVTKNGTSATGYSIVGTSAGQNADIPYTGGKVVFDVAPSSLDNITIARFLPLARIVDYQPTTKLEPTVLNQDINYLMEAIKDRKDEIDGLFSEYSEIANKESTTTLLTRIAELSQQITNLGDISTLRSDVTTNTGDITTLKGYDYVVESQTPTAENNYTWYRKYKSGWVEQGQKSIALNNSVVTTVTLPITMADDNYSATGFCKQISESSMYGALSTIAAAPKNTTQIYIGQYNSVASVLLCGWYVCGMGA